jgi:hypothetical protein
MNRVANVGFFYPTLLENQKEILDKLLYRSSI